MTPGSPAGEIEGVPLPQPMGRSPVVGAIRHALDTTSHGWLHLVAVATDGDVVVLRGRVPSFYLKQMAQATALAVPGVAALRNELEVRVPEPFRQAGDDSCPSLASSRTA
jgi:osmotically-inducible protein OsmY